MHYHTESKRMIYWKFCRHYKVSVVSQQQQQMTTYFGHHLKNTFEKVNQSMKNKHDEINQAMTSE